MSIGGLDTSSWDCLVLTGCRCGWEMVLHFLEDIFDGYFVGFSASDKIVSFVWISMVFDELFYVTSFGLYFELGFGFGQEIHIERILLLFHLTNNFLLNNRSMVFYIIKLERQLRHIHLPTNSIIPLMGRSQT